MKNIIVVTGGAGFVGSNLINLFLKKTKFKIFSIDNYSTGNRKNHLKNKRVKYFKCDTKEISFKLKKYTKNINSVFHFGEFSRIYQSFIKMNECINSNSIGSNAVFNFCLKNKIKLIYSATSASIGNKGSDKNLSPYAFTKAKNLELLENLKKWFNFKFEIIYFYNVYGPNQIRLGDMATVIGIFEEQYKKNIPLTVVKPGNQTRRFTHITDTVKACFLAWKKNKCRHYSISNRKSLSVLQVAKMFNHKIKMIPKRPGERWSSKRDSLIKSKRDLKFKPKYSLSEYIKGFLNSNKKIK